MKKLLPILACVALLSAMAFASGAAMTGYIVDEKCGAHGVQAGADLMSFASLGHVGMACCTSTSWR